MKKDCLQQLLNDLLSLKLQLKDESNKHLEKEILHQMLLVIACIEKFYKPSILKMGIDTCKYKKIKKGTFTSENCNKVATLTKIKTEYDIDEEKLLSFLSEYIKLTEPVKKVEKSINAFKKEDYYSIVGDFFKWYNDDAYLLFKSMWQNKQIHFIDYNKWRVQGAGCYAAIRHLKKGYIFLPDGKSLHTMETIAHEIQHAFEEEKSNYQLRNDNFINFREVSTNFIELLFLHYLKENKMFVDEMYNRQKMNIINARSIALILRDKLTVEKAIKDYYQENNEKEDKPLCALDNLKIIIRLMDKGIYITEGELINAKKSDGPTDEMNLTNYLIAHKIFKLYLRDEKKALNIIESLSTNIDKNPIDIFNEADINISCDSLLFSYEDYIKNIVSAAEIKEGVSKLYK